MNATIFQSFHWYFPACANLWNHLRDEAAHFEELGITHLWLPPAYKSAKGVDDPGYGVYDLYDLGEFEQKGSVRTKFGTKAEYLACIESLHEHGIGVLADIVLNHRFGGDESETVSLIKVSQEDRRQKISEEFRHDVDTRFTFPGRNGKYSGFIWDWQCFSGLSLDGEIHLLLNEYNCGDWGETLNKTRGNFDYLVGNDVELRNPAVREELKRWGEWYVETAALDGFRFDALKHMNCEFPLEWIEHLNRRFGRDFVVIGEYWENDVDELLEYIGLCKHRIPLFDVPLHFKFHEASKSEDFDLRTLFDDTLAQRRPDFAITFVENHDTQPLQDLESPVATWFKPLAYASILLRQQGTPCVFYADLYGAEYEESDRQGVKVRVELPPLELVAEMMKVRRSHAHGHQQDYFDDPHLVGWTRHGDARQNATGCAVLLSNRHEGAKRMSLGAHNRGRHMVDISGSFAEPVRLDDDGTGLFRVKARSASVWIAADPQP